MWVFLALAVTCAIPVDKLGQQTHTTYTVELEAHSKVQDFNVRVVDLSKTTHTITVKPTTTVKQLKDLVKIAQGKDPKADKADFRLYFEAQHLDNADNLAQYSIQEGSVIEEKNAWPNRVTTDDRGTMIYDDVEWWNKKLTAQNPSPVGFFTTEAAPDTDFTVKEERHHICPWNTIVAWWNKMIDTNQVYTCTLSLFKAMKENVGNLEHLSTPVAVRRDVLAAMTKISSHQAPRSDIMSNFVGYLAYAPGNIFLGPGMLRIADQESPGGAREEKARKDDPKDAFEPEACVVDKIRWKQAKAFDNAILEYLRDDDISKCMAVSEAYSELYKYTSTKPLDKLDWVLTHGKYELKHPVDSNAERVKCEVYVAE